MAVLLPLLAAPVVGLGFALTCIKDEHEEVQMLLGNVKKTTITKATRKVARIFAGIFTFGFSELLNHENVSVKYTYEDEYIGSNEVEAAKKLYEMGNEFYEKGDYERAATCFAKACGLTKIEGEIKKYEESLNKTRQKIKEEAVRREREETERREREETARREQEETIRREREKAARRQREEVERLAREEALRLKKSKFLQEEAANIYQQAEALSSLELKLEKYETAVFKCEEACATGATEAVFNTLNRIFESCLKHGAHDEAESVIRVARNYFPSKVANFQNALANEQNGSWAPDYESRVHREQRRQEQIGTVIMVLS